MGSKLFRSNHKKECKKCKFCEIQLPLSTGEKIRPQGMERILDDDNYIVLNKQRIKCLRQAEDFLNFFQSIQNSSEPFTDFEIACNREGTFFSNKGADVERKTGLNEETDIERNREGAAVGDPNQPNEDEWEFDLDICVNRILTEAIDSGKKLYDDTAIPSDQFSTEDELQILGTKNIFRDELSKDELQIFRRVSAAEKNIREQLCDDELQIFRRVLFDYGINSNIEKVFDDDSTEFLSLGDNSVNTSQQDQLEIVPKCPNSKICTFYISAKGKQDKYKCVGCKSSSVPSFICGHDICCNYYSICIGCSIDRRVSNMLRRVMSAHGTACLAGGFGAVNMNYN
jgi:hypothetical protein